MRRILIASSVALVLAAAGAGWLMNTESGLRWAWRTTASWLPGDLQAASVSGVLAGPIELSAASFADGELTLAAGRVELDWNPWALAAFTLEIDSLRIDSLRIALPAANPDPQAEPRPFTAPEIRLPLKLRLEALELRGEAAMTGGIDDEQGFTCELAAEVYPVRRVQLPEIVVEILGAVPGAGRGVNCQHDQQTQCRHLCPWIH